MMSSKTATVSSWYQSTADNRMLRRHRIGVLDVYSPHEEDLLDSEQARRGYQAKSTPFEYGSLVYNSQSAQLDRLDVAQAKSETLLNFVIYQKSEISSLERRKGRDTNAQLAAAKAKERAAWFTDLARGRSLSSLAKKIPIIEGREGLQYLCDYRVPPFRALWYLKITAVLTGSNANVKRKKSVSDLFAAEYKNVFVKAIKDIMARMWNVSDLTASPVYKERWLYISNLCKCAYQDGLLERQDFLNELCNIFTDYFIARIKGAEKLPPLRMYLLFFTQFLRHINNNLILARRVAHMAATKLSMYKMAYEEKRRAKKASKSFIALTNCSALKSVIHMLTAILQSIVIDVPAAVVWNNFKVQTAEKHPFILSQLCGSPLDLLPCPVYKLPHLAGKGSERFIDLLKLRSAEIIRRSQAVQDNWSFDPEALSFAKLVNGYVSVITILDSVDMLEPHIVQAFGKRIFTFKSENWAEEVLMRIKLMLHWAVTAEREGSRRAVIVAKVLHHRVLEQQSYMFGPFHMQDIILSYLDTEAPTPESKFFHREFASLVTLFIELIRFKLFDHDSFVKELIKSGEVDCDRPLMTRFECECKCSSATSSTQAQQIDTRTLEDPARLTDSASHNHGDKDMHLYFSDAMPMNGRILIEMPLRQVEEHRSEAIQRALVLYGVIGWENHVSEMKKIANKICKLWQKKMYLQFCTENKTPFWKHSISSQEIEEVLERFRMQTYYDQVMICGWCAESFSDMICDFVSNRSSHVPTSEALNIICEMFETAQFIYGMFEFCEAVTPLLLRAEGVIHSLAVDVIPGALSARLAYVFVAYICKHWYYFLHSDLAPAITTHMYELIEPMICDHEFPKTAWGRAIAAFVYHSQKHLNGSQLSDMKLHGIRDNLLRILEHGGPACHGERVYDENFYKDALGKTMRFFSYRDYKEKLASFEHLRNRCSFVINSFIAAKDCMRDHDRLVDLATFCGHITAEIPVLANEWIVAIKTLCCISTNESLAYEELLEYIEVSNSSTHYPIATFVMLLAGKYAFSASRLVAELLNSAFPIITGQRFTEESVAHNRSKSELRMCLTLRILAQIVCGTDEPFCKLRDNVGAVPKQKLLTSCADEIMLSMMQWCEMDDVLFPLLSNICILQNTMRSGRGKGSLSGSAKDREYLSTMVEAVQCVICDEDWVRMKMCRIVETNSVEVFGHEQLRRNSVGHQLLRLSICRRSERDVARELSLCSDSKKAQIEKLLAAMNIWNMRATVSELMLMMKEISFGDDAQQSTIAADVSMGVIAKCCRDLFINAYNEGLQISSATIDRDFRFRQVTNFWLLAPLLKMCSRTNIMSNLHKQTTIHSKFLKEAVSMLDLGDGSTMESLKRSSWLLSQEPFLNLVLTCMKLESSQPNKDLLVSLIYRQLVGFTNRIKEDSAVLLTEKFAAERENLLLQLSLIGRMFEQICQPQHCVAWSHLFFQMMFYGIISPDRERILYNSCYDMLSTLMLWTLTHPLTIVQQSKEGSELKFRWPYYSRIVKKLKKEIAGKKVPPESRNLLLFLPLPKKKISVYVMSPCTAASGAARLSCALSPFYRSGLRVSEKMRMSSYEFIGQSIKDGCKWRSWFQATRVDRTPCPIQKWVARLLIHKHQLDYPRSNVITEANDCFLSAADQDASNEAPLSDSGVNPSGTCASDRAHTSIATEAATAGSEETTISKGTLRKTLAENVVLTHEATSLQECSSTPSNPVALAGTTGLGKRDRRSARLISAGISKSVRMDGVKSHTKTKLQERINKKRLEAIRLAGTFVPQQLHAGASHQLTLTAGPVQYHDHLQSYAGRSSSIAGEGQMSAQGYVGLQVPCEGQQPMGTADSSVSVLQMPHQMR
ncbi:unnamed protein product [Cylicocyclus nassatus]|uniref:Mediator complex subunit Med12 domain-containing protein n=1 Tax=Cylicocyclus nassatus TaxID=53992 RepID=A0AA36GN83_CYLNA|nr:unnamed protein product [Cylicocyclus nassatus]